jgi:hypothetical protein
METGLGCVDKFDAVAGKIWHGEGPNEMIPGIIIAAIFCSRGSLCLYGKARTKKRLHIRGASGKSGGSRAQRKSRGDMVKSPMLDGKYDLQDGNLINLIPGAFDSKLRQLCQSFANSDAESRAQIRASISIRSSAPSSISAAVRRSSECVNGTPAGWWTA